MNEIDKLKINLNKDLMQLLIKYSNNAEEEEVVVGIMKEVLKEGLK